MGLVTDPRTDRSRLVGHAYKTSAPFLARTGLYRYQRDGVDIRRWVLDQVAWPADARVLDVGCGPGRYLEKLAEHVPDARAVGMDLSAGMAAEASEFARVLVGDAQALPFGDARFDGVIAAHMLYHVPDVDAAVQEFARVLEAECLRARRAQREGPSARDATVDRRVAARSRRDRLHRPGAQHRTLHARDREPDPARARSTSSGASG